METQSMCAIEAQNEMVAEGPRTAIHSETWIASEDFGQDALEFGVDGQNQGSKFRWNVGIFVELFQFRLSHGYAYVKFLAFVQQPVFARFFCLTADVAWDFGVIDLIDDRGNLFQSFFDVHGVHPVARMDGSMAAVFKLMADLVEPWRRPTRPS